MYTIKVLVQTDDPATAEEVAEVIRKIFSALDLVATVTVEEQ
jgi:hypothetical protein